MWQNQISVLNALNLKLKILLLTCKNNICEKNTKQIFKFNFLFPPTVSWVSMAECGPHSSSVSTGLDYFMAASHSAGECTSTCIEGDKVGDNVTWPRLTLQKTH